MASTPTKHLTTMGDRVADLRERRKKLLAAGGAKRIDKQHAGGKLTARERIAKFIDEGSFQELWLHCQHRATLFGMDGKEVPYDGVVTGAGKVDGRLVHFASQDFTVIGGATGEMHGNKIADAMKQSLSTGTPFIFMNDSGGARVQEGIDALSGYAKIFYENVELSGVVPQVAVIMGPCAGGAVYSPALTDFIIQTRKAQMFITGPSVIKAVTGEDVTGDELGGPEAHMKNSGVVHFVAEDDEDALYTCRRLLSFLPSNNNEEPPRLDYRMPLEPDEELNKIVPDSNKAGYDMHKIIDRIVDRGDFLEVQAGYAQNIIVGFGRVQGRTVGIIANQPAVMAGSLDINASDKGARFIRFCDSFNIPLVTLVDVPGFLPGTQQEYGGIIRHGAKMLFAYSAATVPMITIVVRKAFGGAYIAMCCRDLGADRVYAWPTAEVAVMGAEGAVGIVFRKEIEAAEDKRAKRQEMIDLYRDAFANPYVAAGRRLVDDVIEPAETRMVIANALDALANKRKQRPGKKHGLIPL